MPPFLIAGAVFILVKFAGTLQRFVFEELQGVKDVRTTRDFLRRNRFADPEKERARVDALRRLDTAIGIWDTAIRHSYDPTTTEGRIEMAADFGALGFKLGALKLGIPIVSRVVGALGTRFAVGEGLSLAANIGSIVDIFSGKQAGQTFGEIGDAIKTANELINQGKRAGDALLPLVESGTDLAFDTVDFAMDVGAFSTAPSIVDGVSLVRKGVDLAKGFLEFFGLVQELVPEVEEELRPFEDRRRRGRTVEEFKALTELPVLFTGPVPVGGRGVEPGILPPPIVGPPPFPKPPFKRFPPTFDPTEFAEPGTQDLDLSRQGISDLLRIVQELKKG